MRERERERERGVEPVAEIPDWMVIRLSDGSQERGELISDAGELVSKSGCHKVAFAGD